MTITDEEALRYFSRHVPSNEVYFGSLCYKQLQQSLENKTTSIRALQDKIKELEVDIKELSYKKRKKTDGEES